MGDDFMQIRSMLLLEFGCPPMPIADGKRFETDQPAIINSHDLLSTFLIQMFKRQDPKLNSARKERQAAITNVYYKNLRASGGSFDAVYTAMATYTRDYLGTFLLPPFSVHDVRVLTPDFISPVLKNEISDYRKALRIVHGDDAPEKCDWDLYDLFKDCHRILCLTPEKQSGAQNPQNAPCASPTQPVRSTSS